MKCTIKVLIILVLCSIIGFLSLYLVYLLPTNIMYNNVKESKMIFEKEKTHPNIMNSDSSKLDNYTDSLMLLNAIYDGKKNNSEKTLGVYKSEISRGNHTDSLISYLNNKNDRGSDYSYVRYWHGYLVILKPLLLIFNYGNIRYLNSMFQMALFMSVIYFMHKKDLKKYIIPYIISIFLINPNVIALSMQFSIIYYIFNIAMLITLIFNDKFNKNNNYRYFFLIIGITTSYFDFLTYPIATLGMPLILYLLMNDKKNIKQKIIKIVEYSFFWTIGYALMWTFKFAISSILLGENTFVNGINQAKSRMSFSTGKKSFGPLYPICCNLYQLYNIPSFLLIIFSIIYYLIRIFKYSVKKVLNAVKCTWLYLIICIMPICWYVILSNHSTIHSWFTYRALIVSIFGGLCMLVKTLSILNERKN